VVRNHPLMKDVAGRLSDPEIVGLATYFSKKSCQQTPLRLKSKPVQADNCLQCHRPESDGGMESAPKIAGQRKDYLFKQLLWFRSSATGQKNLAWSPQRHHKEMDSFINGTDTSVLSVLAGYFASLPCR
jgi:cytochrome c553